MTENQSITIFTEEEKEQLATIVKDKFSVGAFSGMIYNAQLAHPDKTTDELIKTALDVRNRIIEISGAYEYKLEVEQQKIGSETVPVNKFVKVIKKA